VASAQVVAAGVYQFRGEEKLTQEMAETAVSLYSEHGFVEFLAMGRWMRGWAISKLGQQDDGIREIVDGIENYRSVGSGLYLSWPLGLLAEAYASVGQIDKAFTFLTEALDVVEQNGEHFYEAELIRLKGELLLKRPDRDEDPEACFRQAIAFARDQSAKTWELGDD